MQLVMDKVSYEERKWQRFVHMKNIHGTFDYYITLELVVRVA